MEENTVHSYSEIDLLLQYPFVSEPANNTISSSHFYVPLSTNILFIDVIIPLGPKI